MNKLIIAWSWLAWSAVALTAMSGAAFAADCPTDIKAVTNTDVKVPIEVLSYRLKPLTKCELEAEAQAWLLLLKDKVTEISNAEVAAIYKKEEIKKTEQVESTLEEAEKAKEAEPEAAQEAARKAKQARKEAKDAAMKSSGILRCRKQSRPRNKRQRRTDCQLVPRRQQKKRRRISKLH
jgi:hypothetical protein